MLTVQPSVALPSRRSFTVTASASALALLLVGCDSGPKPDRTATLLNSEEVKRAMAELLSAIDALESDVDEFDSKSWREVVPEVKDSAANVSSAADRLKSALGYQ